MLCVIHLVVLFCFVSDLGMEESGLNYDNAGLNRERICYRGIQKDVKSYSKFQGEKVKNVNDH